MKSQLPKIENTGFIPEYFPTSMQAFIFRNWEMVSTIRIASVLKTTEENVEAEAARMGLCAKGDTDLWSEKGYLSIIRANWHLLPYSQLLELLDWSEEKLSATLKEEDFLDVKLGRIKPYCEPVYYYPLTDEEIEKTQKICSAIKPIDPYATGKKPFDFWHDVVEKSEIKSSLTGQVALNSNWYIIDRTNDEVVGRMADRFCENIKNKFGIEFSGDEKKLILEFSENKNTEYHKITVKENEIIISAGGSAGVLRGLYYIEDADGCLDPGEYERIPRFESRYIYSFSSLYEGALDVDSRQYYPDDLLERYARVGVNGIWLQAVLYRITEFPFDKSLSSGWEIRQKNLKDFAKRAIEYGIKIYLYINEPRTAPLSFFDKYPHLKGAVSGGYACLCTSEKETRDYLETSVESLCRAVPEIGGFVTICMSENLTHCKSREVDIPCEKCAHIPVWEMVAEVNNCIERGAHRVNPNIKVIAWNWAWSKSSGFAEGDVEKCIKAMPECVSILATRENGIPFNRGIESAVDEYCLSVEGIGPQTAEIWKTAKKHGHKIAAKLQINNTWECSTVPYLPIFKSLGRIIDSLIEYDVNDLMLSWTLGGYPSPSIKMISEAFFIENGTAKVDYDKSIKKMYGDSADNIIKATELFSEAFSNFPYEIFPLYFAPQNNGVANPLYHKPTGHKATMTNYNFDDLEKWRGPYPEDVFEDQFEKLSTLWGKGIESLKDVPMDFYDNAYMAYTLFRSAYRQIRFVRLRGDAKKNKDVLLNIISEERETAKEVYDIMCKYPAIGFEAANHYYITRAMVLEKIINCNYLESYYLQEF